LGCGRKHQSRKGGGGDDQPIGAFGIGIEGVLLGVGEPKRGRSLLVSRGRNRGKQSDLHGGRNFKIAGIEARSPGSRGVGT